MEKYNNPTIKIITIDISDIITTSLGTETTPKDENDGNWEYTL